MTAAGLLVLSLAACSFPGLSVESNPLSGGLPVPTQERTVTYRVTGDGVASVTWMTVDAGAIGQESATAQSLPFETTATFDEALGLSYTAFTVVAVGNEATTELGCEIEVDGETVSTQQSSGAFSTVTCSISG
jgi:hypothetical protein